MFQKNIWTILLSLILITMTGLTAIGCGDSRGPATGFIAATPGGPEVTVTATVTTTNMVEGATNAVVGTFTITGNNSQDLILGGATISDLPSTVTGVHFTTANQVVGIGTKQDDGKWLVTPVNSPYLRIVDFRGAQSHELQVRADLSMTTNQVFSTTLERIYFLDTGLTNRWVQDKFLSIGQVIATPVATTPTTLPDAGPLPDPVNIGQYERPNIR